MGLPCLSKTLPFWGGGERKTKCRLYCAHERKGRKAQAKVVLSSFCAARGCRMGFFKHCSNQMQGCSLDCRSGLQLCRFSGTDTRGSSSQRIPRLLTAWKPFCPKKSHSSWEIPPPPAEAEAEWWLRLGQGQGRRSQPIPQPRGCCVGREASCIVSGRPAKKLSLPRESGSQFRWGLPWYGTWLEQSMWAAGSRHFWLWQPRNESSSGHRL